MDVGAWLNGLGLGQYEQVFRDAEIDAAVLPRLTDEHLKELGLPLGPRLKLLVRSRTLGAAVAAPVHSRGRTACARGAPAAHVMFTDLVGSTALASRLDPEEMRHLLRGYQNTVAGEVARFERPYCQASR